MDENAATATKRNYRIYTRKDREPQYNTTRIIKRSTADKIVSFKSKAHYGLLSSAIPLERIPKDRYFITNLLLGSCLLFRMKQDNIAPLCPLVAISFQLRFDEDFQTYNLSYRHTEAFV